jgi:hypothetical protein
MATITIKAPEGSCGCGCGAEVSKGRTFRQGHDARLRGILGKAYKAGETVVYNGKSSTAEAALKQHGFPIPPPAKPRKPRKAKTTAKRTTKKTTAKKTTRKRVARKPKAAAAS